MSIERTAARRAWTLSLTLHSILVTGLLALAPPRTAAPPVAIDTRADGMALGLVVLAEPALPPPSPLPVPVIPAAAPLPVVRSPEPVPPPPLWTVPPPPEPSVIQPVVHTELSLWSTASARPILPTIEGPPPAVTTAPPGPARPAVELPPGAVTAFFGVPAVGHSVVFVIDRSASMGMAERLDRAKREVAASLGRLPPGATFQIIAYNRGAEPLRFRGQSGLLPATPDAVAEALAAVERLSAEGGTNHMGALRAALMLRPDVIYFLTDEDELTRADVNQFTQANHGRVCVHALCLVAPGPGNETPMQALARSNRGVFRVVR